MRDTFICRLASFLFLAGVLVGTANAQRAQISTVEGPGAGEKTTLSTFPHAAGDGISLRAVGVQAPDTTRWSLTVIGIRKSTVDVRLTADGELLTTTEVTNPNPQTGPHQVSFTKEEFLILTNAGTAQITVNGTTVSLPEALQVDMRAIFKKVV